MALAAGSAVILITAANVGFPYNNKYNANDHAARLRADILGSPLYDALVPPTSDRKETQNEAGHYSDSGTDVQVGIRFFKVEAVKAAEASMRLKVWVRMAWKDLRLAWTPADYGGITETFYRADQSIGSEASEIWLPDLQPYNALSSFVQTLEPSFARVSSDGSIFWSRPGSLEILCKFSGLVAFPFDNLKCKMEIGGWILSGGQQGLQLLGTGYQFSSQEVTSGASYQEMAISQVNVSLKTYTYPCCPSEPWPVLLYTITMTRVWFSYFPLVIFPGILITVLSFAVFLTDTGSADALGYGIGVIVVNLLSNFILLGMLPICGETLWVDLFSNVNTGFCCISLIQSSINIMLENHEDDHLLPLWLHVPLSRVARWVYKALPKSAAHVLPASGKTDLEDLSSAGVIDESVAGVIFRRKYGNSGTETTRSHIGMRAAATGEETEKERAEKLVFYEKIFYKLDEDCSLFISQAECELLLSYAAIDLDPQTRKTIFKKHDFISDGKLNRVEFVGMCADVLWDVPMDLMWQAMENMDVARKSRVKRNSVYWHGVAASLDGWARYVLPGVYIFALIILFNLDLSDRYADGALTQEEQAFYGFGPTSLTTTGIVMIFVYSLGIVAISYSTHRLNWISKKREAEVQAKLKDASRASAEDMGKQVSMNTVAAVTDFNDP